MKKRNNKELENKLQELLDKVWWNRHMYYRYQIEIGNEPYPKSIDWEATKKLADSMVRKYGKEELELEPFEWGMLNGRLAMLRWVLGDDWANLDT